MLGDNGAEEAMFQGVGGIGWQLYGVLTVQGNSPLVPPGRPAGEFPSGAWV